MKAPVTAVDPHLAEHQYKPIWVVYGSTAFPSLLCCKINHCQGVACIWGYSVWKRVPGFRTLGQHLSQWVEKSELCFFFADQQHALDFLKLTTTPKVPK